MASAGPSKLRPANGDTVGGEGITMIPENQAYSKVVVWAHGLGDTAEGWYSAMPAFGLSETKFILPTATERPITLNMGFRMPAWSDIIGLSKEDREDEEGFNESLARMDAIVGAEIDKGISPSKIVVGGFSQGGALALYYALQNKRGIAGCVSFSGWLPLRPKFPSAITAEARSLKILQCHGTDDAVVQMQWGRESYEAIKNEFSLDAQWEAFEGMGHSACEEEIEKASNFLKGVLL